MARHEITAPPEGTTVVQINKAYFPMAISYGVPIASKKKSSSFIVPIPIAKSFVRLDTGDVVYYSKRSYAVNFLYRYKAGATPHVRIVEDRDYQQQQQSKDGCA